MATTRFFVYIRGDTASCGKQREMVRAFCERNGIDWHHVTVCEDPHVSGYSLFERRPGGHRLMDMLRAGDQVIVRALDRISLDLPELIRVLGEFADTGATLHVDRNGTTYGLDGETLSLVLDAMRDFGCVPRYDN